MAKWPQLQKRRLGFLRFCLHAPEGQELLRRFIAVTLAPIANHPALHSICLANEPVNPEEPCEPAKAQWRAWLEKRHENIQQLNACYGSTYASFDAVPLPDPLGPRPSLPVWMDYVRFNQEDFADWHKMLADAIHKVAPSLPVHTKAMAHTLINGTTVSQGVDATLFGAFSNINGCDGAAFLDFSSQDAEIAVDWQTSGMTCDLLRSVFDAPVFNSENHLIMDRETSRIPANRIRAALWQEAVHGQSATTIWVWEVCYDNKHDLAGNIMYRPACTEAVGIVNCDLNRAAPEITALQQAKPDVLLLQSFTSPVWDQGYDHCLMQLYTALSFTGLKVGFLSERQLEGGLVPDAPVVFVPDIAHLSDAAAASLRKFSGHLVFVGKNDALARTPARRAHRTCTWCGRHTQGAI
jgi:hypothetical protein